MVVKLMETWSNVTVRVEFEPAYELVISLMGYADKQFHRTLDIGSNWTKDVNQSIGPNLAKRLQSPTARRLIKNFPGITVIDRLAGDKSASKFVEWMSGMTRGEIYDYLTTKHVLKNHVDIPQVIDGWPLLAELLGEWNQRYFRNVSSDVLQALVDDAAQKRSLAKNMPIDEFIQLATIGARLEPDPNLRQVVLIPQYHLRPWNVTHWTGDTWYNQYPVEYDASGNDPAWTRVLRMAQALAEENRLRILQKIAEGPIRFTDLVKASDVTKSTVHHHLVSLRAARLVVLRTDVSQRQQTYELNPNLIDDAAGLLEQVLGSPRRHDS
jgi:DNA-binding transcriptional ArsR family regulator